MGRDKESKYVLTAASSDFILKGMGATSTMGGSLTVIPIGEKLLELRKARELTQKQVEEACGIKYLWLYEAGKPAPIQHVKALASFFGVKSKALVTQESWEINAALMRDLVEFQGYSVTVPSMVEQPAELTA